MTIYRATPLDRGALSRVTPAQCSRLFIELQFSIGEHYHGLHPLNAHVPALRAVDSLVGSLTGWPLGGFGRMPGLDAALALRAVLRRFVVRCRFCGPSMSFVLGDREFLDGVASLDACVQIRVDYRATPLDRGAFAQVSPAQCSRPCPTGRGQPVVNSWGDFLGTLGECPGWTQELRYALSCVVWW